MTRHITRRTQLCPMDGESLDAHTNEELVDCNEAATAYYNIARDFAKAPVTRVHSSWSYRLSKEYQS